MRFFGGTGSAPEGCVERTRSLRKRSHYVAVGLHLFFVAPNFNLIGFEDGISLPQPRVPRVYEVSGGAGTRNRVSGNMGGAGATSCGPCLLGAQCRQVCRNDPASAVYFVRLLIDGGAPSACAGRRVR